MTPTAVAQSLAATQGGHIAWGQLLECGLSPAQIKYRCRAYGWTKVLPQIYRVTGIGDSFASRVAATALWLGTSGHFVSTTAGHLFGLDGVRCPGRITVARTSVPPTPNWLKVIRLSRTDRPHLRTVGGRRVPPVERVLLGLAADLPRSDAGRALDDALRRRLTTLDRLNAMLKADAGQGRKGAGVLRSLLETRDLRDEKVRTLFETRMLRILRRVDTFVSADHEVRVTGERFVLDFYLPEVLLGVECHSIRWHLGDEAFKRDVRRHRLISSAGIELLFFTWDEVMTAPARVEAEVRAAVERRRPHFLSS